MEESLASAGSGGAEHPSNCSAPPPPSDARDSSTPLRSGRNDSRVTLDSSAPRLPIRFFNNSQGRLRSGGATPRSRTFPPQESAPPPVHRRRASAVRPPRQTRPRGVRRIPPQGESPARCPDATNPTGSGAGPRRRSFGSPRANRLPRDFRNSRWKPSPPSNPRASSRPRWRAKSGRCIRGSPDRFHARAVPRIHAPAARSACRSHPRHARRRRHPSIGAPFPIPAPVYSGPNTSRNNRRKSTAATTDKSATTVRWRCAGALRRSPCSTRRHAARGRALRSIFRRASRHRSATARSGNLRRWLCREQR